MNRILRASACLCIGATVAHAEALDLGDVSNVEDLALADLLERPVSVASRYVQRPQDSPFLVSTVDADQLGLLGYRTIGDVLRSMRGVYVTNDRNYSYLGARGFSIPGDYNTRFVLAIDGHRINDAVYGQASLGLELGLPMIAIDHVELMRGGAWSVYGQNALLGAVQVVTATGASRPGLVVRGTTNATFETYSDPAQRPTVAPRAQDVAASYGKVVGDLDIFAAAQYAYDPGLDALYMPELATPDETCIDGRLQPRTCDGIVHGSDAEEVTGAYLALRTDTLAIHAMASRRRKEVPTAAFATIIGDTVETFDDRMYLDAEVGHHADRTDLDARLAVDYYGYSGDYPYDEPRDGYAALPDSRVINKDFASAVWVTGELRGRYQRAHYGRYLSNLELAAGAEAQIQDGSQSNYDALPEGRATYVDVSATGKTAALTAHATARAFDRIVGFAAVRGDYSSAASGLAIDPQLGLVLDLEEVGRLRASLSRGFRAPNLYERYYLAPEYVLNPALGPEHSETRELSFEHYVGTHARLLAVAYSQQITDLIAITDLGDGTRQFQNQGTSRAYGAEVELEGRWDALHLRTSYAWQHARDGEGQPRVNSPRSLGVLTALVPIGSRGALAIESNYIGSRLTLAGDDIAQVFLTNVSVMVRDVSKGIDLTLGVRNLFDARTDDPGSEDHRQSRIPQDPRTVWLQLTARVGGG